ncbi:hypothetical protein Pcinc_000319 [Petrolisthes cinctipes]|uniref:Regulatory protein zeste n=1 Tax=Petrolisthes cinctipes TaxID=88211 RepID=A0AAE1GNE5_PETCI|nr:hypothetical protein Pcinc_000319 [Petrolisthes cinctipes]
MATSIPQLSQSLPKDKKPRKGNWSRDETKLLLELYQENATVLKASFSSGITSRQKQTTWQNMASQLHEVFPANVRTVKECQKRWQTVQSAAKANLSRHNEAMRGTGGGPAAPPLDDIDEMVADILGKKNHGMDGIDDDEEVLRFIHDAVEVQPSTEAAEKTQDVTPADVIRDEPAAEASADHSGTNLNFMVVDEGEAAHLQKKRKLELLKLEQELLAKKKSVEAQEAKIKAQEAKIKAYQAKANYYVNKEK